MKSWLVVVSLTVKLTLALSGCSPAPETPTYDVAEYANSVALAAMYLAELKESGALPGVHKDDHGEAKLEASLKRTSASELPKFSFPIQVEATFVNESEKEFTYRYFLKKQGYDDPWVLENVWKIDRAGKTVDENFAIPSDEIQRDVYRSLKNGN